MGEDDSPLIYKVESKTYQQPQNSNEYVIKRVGKPITERFYYQSKKISKTSVSEKKSTPVYSKMKSEQIGQNEMVNNVNNRQHPDTRGNKNRTVYSKQKSQIVCVDQILKKVDNTNLKTTEDILNITENSPDAVPHSKKFS